MMNRMLFGPGGLYYHLLGWLVRHLPGNDFDDGDNDDDDDDDDDDDYDDGDEDAFSGAGRLILPSGWLVVRSPPWK